MWCPHSREVGGLIDRSVTIITTSDGHGSPKGDWDRARRAYRALVAVDDPAAAAIAGRDALDLRPGGTCEDRDGPRVVVRSGPNDLVELRTIVESITGAGTWPAPAPAEGALCRSTLRLERPAGALALVDSMRGLVEDRSGMWRTWKTVVEQVGARLVDIDRITIEALITTPD